MPDTTKGFSIFPIVVLKDNGPNFGLHLPYARSIKTNFEEAPFANVVFPEIGSPPKLSVGSLEVRRMPASKSSHSVATTPRRARYRKRFRSKNRSLPAASLARA